LYVLVYILLDDFLPRISSKYELSFVPCLEDLYFKLVLVPSIVNMIVEHPQFYKVSPHQPRVLRNIRMRWFDLTKYLIPARVVSGVTFRPLVACLDIDALEYFSLALGIGFVDCV
jgi:hypothetical protein